MNEREAFEAWFKEKSPVCGINAKLAARDAWLARAAVEADRAQRVPDAAAERERILGMLTRADFSSSTIFRLYYPSLAGDWVDLCELRALLASTPAQPAPQPVERKPSAEQVLEKVLAIVRGYLPPDGMLAENAMSEIIALVDPWPFGDPKGPK